MAFKGLRQPGRPLTETGGPRVPLSAFRLGHDAPHTLLVAGSIGVTPTVAMTRSLRCGNDGLTLFYAGLERGAMTCADELEALCDDHFTLCEARRSGTPGLRALLSAQSPGTVAHVCGPGAMTEALRVAAASLGWEPDWVRSEVFNTAHRPKNESFEV